MMLGGWWHGNKVAQNLQKNLDLHLKFQGYVPQRGALTQCFPSIYIQVPCSNIQYL
jgi:hypothetical protein